MKVTRAVGQGFSVTHKGWPVITVIFVFYAIVRFFAGPNEEIPPYMKSLGDWGAAALIFAVMVLGVNYLLAGVQAFARDGIRDGRYGFKGFFGNCNRYFLRQLGVSAVLCLPIWILAFLAIGLLSGAIMTVNRYIVTSISLWLSSAIMMFLLAALLTLTSESWAIVSADGRGVFGSIGRSFIFCGRRFFSVLGLLSLVFILAIVISLVIWIIYAFIVQGLRRLELDNYIAILREITGCALYAYFFLFNASSLMSYYLNNRKEDERYN